MFQNIKSISGARAGPEFDPKRRGNNPNYLQSQVTSVKKPFVNQTSYKSQFLKHIASGFRQPSSKPVENVPIAQVLRGKSQYAADFTSDELTGQVLAEKYGEMHQRILMKRALDDMGTIKTIPRVRSSHLGAYNLPVEQHSIDSRNSYSPPKTAKEHAQKARGKIHSQLEMMPLSIPNLSGDHDNLK